MKQTATFLIWGVLVLGVAALAIIGMQLEVADLRAKLGESEKRIAELQPLLGDSATYIRRMARMLRDHPSRIQLRAIDFVTKKLSAFERHIVPMNGDEPA